MQRRFFCRAGNTKAFLACFFFLLVCTSSVPFSGARAQVVIRERLELTPPATRMTLVAPASQSLPPECQPRGAEYDDYVDGGETSQTAKVKGTFVFIPRTAHFVGGELGGTFEIVNETQQDTTRFIPSLALSQVIEGAACYRSGEAARLHIYSGSTQQVRVPVNAGDLIRVYHHFNGRAKRAVFSRYQNTEDGFSYRTLSVNNACHCCYVCICFRDPGYMHARLSMKVYFEPELPDRFALSFGRDTLTLGESTWLQVQAKDAEDNPVFLDDDAPVYLSLSTTRYGSFYDTVSGTRASRLDNYRYGDAKRKKVYYVADGDPGEAAPTSGMASLTSGAGTVLASAVPVRVTAVGCNLSGSKALRVTPALDHFEVEFDDDPLRHRKVTSVRVQAKDVFGNAIDIADDTRLTLRLLQGADLGSMKRSLAQAGDDVISVTYGDVRPDAGAASGVVFWADGINPVGWEQHDRTVRIAASLSEDPARQGWGTLEVLGDYRIRLSVDPDTVLHRETAILQVQAMDLEGLPVSIPDHLPVDFELASASAAYGMLQWKDQEGTRLTGVPYAAARAWEVRFVATGTRPDDATQVEIRASLANDSWIADASILSIKGSIWDLVYYSQGDSRWRADQYDTYKRKNRKKDSPEYFTIGEKGCAMTAMAMVLRGAGEDVSPGELNAWMKKNNGFDGSDVKWNTPEKYSLGKVKLTGRVGSNRNLRNGKTLPLESMDPYLQDNHLVIAQVRSPRGGQHWVVVTKRRGSDYVILDPGYDDRKTLVDHDNNIYRFMTYSQNY